MELGDKVGGKRTPTKEEFMFFSSNFDGFSNIVLPRSVASIDGSENVDLSCQILTVVNNEITKTKTTVV